MPMTSPLHLMHSAEWNGGAPGLHKQRRKLSGQPIGPFHSTDVNTESQKRNRTAQNKPVMRRTRAPALHP